MAFDPDYDNVDVRRKATARAAKMMKLFNPTDFARIMKAVDPPPHSPGVREPQFSNACNQAGLSAEETRWLKAYLSHCDQANYRDPLQEAAASGW